MKSCEILHDISRDSDGEKSNFCSDFGADFDGEFDADSGPKFGDVDIKLDLEFSDLMQDYATNQAAILTIYCSCIIHAIAQAAKALSIIQII